jgi:hypothetical protein
VAEQLTSKFDYVAGDATATYDGRVRRYIRHVVLVKGLKTPVVVLCDDIEAAQPSTYQFMLHALSPFDVDQEKASLSLDRPKAGLKVQYLSAAPLALRQWDGYDPQPTKKFPNQWHVEAATQTKQPRVEMLTLLVPYRKGQAVNCAVKRIETAASVGLEGTIGGEPIHVEFRRAGGTAKPTFDGAILVKP